MDNRGFIFIELILGLIILLTIGSILLPKLGLYNLFYEKYEVYRFVNDIRYARNKATVENKNYYLYILDEKSYAIKENNQTIETIRREFRSNLEILNPGSISRTGFKSNGTVEKAKTIPLKANKKRIDLSITPVVCNINKKEFSYE